MTVGWSPHTVPQADGRSRTFRIIHAVSSLNVGGMEQFVLRIAEAQQRRGHRVSILAIREGGPLEREAALNGVEAHVLEGHGKITRAMHGLTYLASQQPDIVHAHNLPSLPYARLAKRVSRARVVLTLHGRSRGERAGHPPGTWRSTDAIVAVSEATAAGYRSPATLDRLSVIRNGVRLPAAARNRRSVRDELGIGSGRLVGIIVARIDGLKGHDTVLAALSDLRAAHVPAAVLMVGDGAERARMERLSEELGLDREWVRFLGFRTDVSDLLAASDLFLLPSVSEGIPLSMLEAMACRLPIVATPVGGIPEVVEHQAHGLHVPVGDPRALAAAMTALACDPERRRALGDAGYERVASAFSFEAMTWAYDDLYARCHGLTVPDRRLAAPAAGAA